MNKHLPDIRTSIDHCFADMDERPSLRDKVLAQARGEGKVKKKLTVGLILAIVLALAAVTALAAALTGYFSGFAKLEDTYGEFGKWPSSAKVELVQVMLENGVLSEADVPGWQALSETEKVTSAERILAKHFEGMTYIDTYEAMTRELGSIENWTDEQRALFTSLLEKYGKLTDSWIIYKVPGQKDLSREQAVAQARDALLQKFSVSAQELDYMAVNAIFSVAVDAGQAYGASEGEPFWLVEFDNGMTYRVYMTRNGEMLGLEGPQTQYIAWGRNVMDGCTEAVPSEHDASREQAIVKARSALTEIMSIPCSDVDEMDATAHFFYSDLYVYGDEPVWLVTWSKRGKVEWQVLLGYDGSFMDVEPAGKAFDHVLRYEALLSDLCASHYKDVGLQDPNMGEGYYYWWSLEDKAAFYQAFADFVNDYASAHPYFKGVGISEWEWTRNVSSLPTPDAIPLEKAQQIAVSAVSDKTGDTINIEDFAVFYYTTYPDQPEWRFANPSLGISINAYTGEVLLLAQANKEDSYSISSFLAKKIPPMNAD